MMPSTYFESDRYFAKAKQTNTAKKTTKKKQLTFEAM